jgi:hypothetical protein
VSRDDEIRAAIEAHPLGDRLARLVSAAALAAADEQRTRFGDGLDELAKELEIPRDEATVAGVKVLATLGRAEPPVEMGRRVLGALLARGVALDPLVSDEAAGRVAEALAWLAANTYLDGLSALGLWPMGASDTRLWSGLAALVRAADERGAPGGRGSAAIAALALAGADREPARSLRRELVTSLRDPLLVGALAHAPGGEPEAGDERLHGEIVPAPASPFGLFLWCASGLIILRYLGRFITQGLLRAKRPAELTIESTGVTLSARLDLLGRTLRERRTHIPLGNLARAERELRYPRLGLYAGLMALAIGTFIGASLFTDGARSGSPSLIAMGALVFAIGLVLDWLLGTLLPARQGSHRLVFVPRKGPRVAMRVDDEAAADRALRRLLRAP